MEGYHNNNQHSNGGNSRPNTNSNMQAPPPVQQGYLMGGADNSMMFPTSTTNMPFSAAAGWGSFPPPQQHTHLKRFSKLHSLLHNSCLVLLPIPPPPITTTVTVITAAMDLAVVGLEAMQGSNRLSKRFNIKCQIIPITVPSSHTKRQLPHSAAMVLNKDPCTSSNSISNPWKL